MKNKKIKFLGKKNLLVAILIILTFVFSYSSIVLAQETPAQGEYGLKKTTEEGFGKVPSEAEADIPSIIGTIIGAGLSFIGILFFILVIYGGYLWMTARGNEEQVGKAISIVTQASIGLIIVAAAYLITRFLGETILKQVIK